MDTLLREGFLILELSVFALLIKHQQLQRYQQTFWGRGSLGQGFTAFLAGFRVFSDGTGDGGSWKRDLHNLGRGKGGKGVWRLGGERGQSVWVGRKRRRYDLLALGQVVEWRRERELEWALFKQANCHGIIGEQGQFGHDSEGFVRGEEAAGQGLQQICRITLEFQRASGMRLSLTLFLTLLVAELVRGAVLQAGDRPAPTAAPALSFDQFMQLYGKHYSSLAELHYRRLIFEDNLLRLDRHNANPKRTYTMSPNSFLDVASAEFQQLYTATRRSDHHSRSMSDEFLHGRPSRLPCRHPSDTAQRDQLPECPTATHNISLEPNNQTESSPQDPDQPQTPSQRLLQDVSSSLSASLSASLQRSFILKSDPKLSESLSKSLLPASQTNVNVDWSLYSGQVKYQGFCGACYAFSTVDTVSALNAINKLGFFVPLSVQQIVDCVDNGLTYGCSGGFLEGAFTYIQMKGITTEQAYPYASGKVGRAGKCKFEGGPFKVSSFRPIAEGDCSGIISALKTGPVSAGISGTNLQFYHSGVFNECNNHLDHAIVIVGYRSGKGWKIKNSWGREWGEDGYGWIEEGNTCGICNMAVLATL